MGTMLKAFRVRFALPQADGVSGAFLEGAIPPRQQEGFSVVRFE